MQGTWVAVGEAMAANRVGKAFPRKELAVVWVAAFLAAPGFGCDGKNRPAEVYNGYTYPSPDNVSLKTLLPQKRGGKSCHFCCLHSVFQLLQPLVA